MPQKNKTKLNIPKKTLSTIMPVLALSIAITTSPPPLKVHVSDEVSIKDSCQVSVISANKSVVNKFAILDDDPDQTRSAGLGANVDTGNSDWISPTNIYISDDVDAYSQLPLGTLSDYLWATTFGFAIPDGSTINGICVYIERQCNRASAVKDATVKLIKAGSQVGSNKALATFWETVDTPTLYGSATDLWGTTWTPAQINASNFGVALSAANNDYDSVTTYARVDHIYIVVWYTEGAPPDPLSISKAESIAITEARIVQVSAPGYKQISKAESIAVTESRTVQVSAPITRSISKAESVAITEAISLEVPISALSIDKIESIAVTEDKTVQISTPIIPQISKAESIAVTEAKTVQISAPTIPSISKAESVIVTEAVSLQVTPAHREISKAESIEVSESVALQISPAYRELSVAESVAVSEDKSLQIVDAFRTIDVSDSIAISEDKDLFIQSPLFVKVDGTWKPLKVYAKVDGTWKLCSAWAKHDGTWDKI